MFEQAFKNIDDILWKEAGCTTELDYTEQTSWLLFLKYLDGLEQDLADEAALRSKKYEYILEKPFRWESWAAPKTRAGVLDHNKALTGDDLRDFVNQKLFPYLHGFKQRASGPNTIEYKVGEIFGEIRNNPGGQNRTPFRKTGSCALKKSSYFTGVALPGGNVVIAARVGDPARIDKTFHLFDAVGNYRRSFTDDSTTIITPQIPSYIRWLTPSTRGGFWSVFATRRYRIDHWTANGDHIAGLDVSSDWFRPYERQWLITPERPPAPTISGIAEDNNGRLWITGQVHDSRWRESLSRPTQVEGQTYYPVADRRLVSDGIVEILNPTTGRVIHSQRFDHEILYLLQPGVIGKRVEEGGRRVIEIVELRGCVN